MIIVALALLGFGIGDLVRWSPDPVGKKRAAIAVLAGAAAVAIVSALCGMPAGRVALATIVALLVLFLWSADCLLPSLRVRPEYPLAFMVGTMAAAIALSGAAEPIGGDAATWYSNLDFGFVHEVPLDQFVLGVGALLFLLSTGNRIVSLTLAATSSSLAKQGEGAFRGGRLLGPMERLIVVASVVSGDLAGAGFVIAAKGLLRFREIRASDKSTVDEVTEYFLIGTFVSVVLAAAVGVLLLAAT